MQAVPTEVRRVQQTLPLELQEPGVGPGKGTLVEEQYALCSRTISVLAVIELLMSSTWVIFPLLFSMGIGLYSPPYDLAYSTGTCLSDQSSCLIIQNHSY